MAYKFLVYVPREGVPTLTEGGVYCDDSAILASASDYRGNNFARGAADLDALNSRGEFATPPYELRDAIDGVDATDSDVLSSLVDWQLSAILDGAAELGTLSNASAVYRERGRRVVDSAVAPCFVLLDVTGTAEHYAGDARAALHLAGENSSIWHKPGGAERPYQLDAFRLNALADMETGRALMGRGSDGTDAAGRLAEAIAAAFGRDVPDTLARELGRIAGISERLADAKASVSEWKAEAEAAGRARETAENRYRAVSLDVNRLRADLATADSASAKLSADCLAYRQQRDSEGARAVAAERIADAMTKAFHAEKAAHESLDRVTRPLMAELGGLTLSMLPAGAYGGALAAAYTEARYAFTVATPDARAAAFISKGAA